MADLASLLQTKPTGALARLGIVTSPAIFERPHPVNRSIFLLVGALGLGTMLHAENADAGRWSRGGGVRVHARGGVSVHWSRPARSWYRPRATWSVGGSVYVGSGYYPRYRYYRPYYAESYVPSYYGTTYYPVAPAPAVQAIVVAPRPELPKFGIGLFAGGVAVEDTDDSSDIGVLARIRLGNGGFLIEGELGKTEYANDLRVDRRLGGSLIYEIGAYNRLAPYVLAGLGVQQADVAGEFTTNQNFAEIGIGLRYAITPKFHLAVDFRAGSRNSMSSDDPQAVEGTIARTVAPPSSDSDESEEYTRARLSALLYF